MRVTNQMIANTLKSGMQNNIRKLARTQLEISTGKRIHHPSDDPAMISRLMNLRGTLEGNAQYVQNIDDGLSFLEAADTALGTMAAVFHQAYEYAVQGASGTLNTEDMGQIASQIDKIIDNVVDLANTSIGGKYIFAGRGVDGPVERPFQREGDTIIYKGGDGHVEREILFGASYTVAGPGVAEALVKEGEEGGENAGKIVINELITGGHQVIEKDDPGKISLEDLISMADPGMLLKRLEGLTEDLKEELEKGNDINSYFGQFIEVKAKIAIGDDDAAETITVAYKVVWDNDNDIKPNNIFKALFEMRDALNDGDQDALNDIMGRVQDTHDDVLRERVKVGARTRHFEGVKDQMLDQELLIKQSLVNIDGIDMEKTSIDWAQQQLNYMAALSAGGNILTVSLLDFLR